MTAITVLRCAPGFRATKLFTSEGKEDYDAGKWFTVERRSVDDIRSLSAVLTGLAGDAELFPIRGEPKDWTDLTRPRQKNLENFSDVPIPWLCVDLDGLPGDWHDLADLQAIGRAARAAIGPAFANVTCHVQLSASAAPGKPLRVHVWFWLTHAMDSVAARTWAKALRSKTLPVDAGLYNGVQPHFTADPIFAPGAIDPLDGAPRLALVLGEVEKVPPILPPASHEIFPDRYLSIIAKLGDGPKPHFEGCHDVLLRATAAYVRGGGLAFETLKADIRARGERATFDKRSPEYLAEQFSDHNLDEMIRSARRKYTPTADALFTPTELEVFGDVWPRQLLLARGKSRYVFNPETRQWFTVAATDARTALAEYCGRFPIVWTEPAGKLKKPADLEFEYATTLTSETVHDLCAPAARVEPDGHGGHRLRLRAAPIRALEPVYSPEVDAWIETLSRPDVVRAWLRDFVHFDRALFGLILTGPKGTGKSGFAAALALGLWGRPYTDATTIFPPNRGMFVSAPWTRPLLDCPFACAPEGLPRVSAAQLRSFIGDMLHTIREKGVSDSTLQGFCRLLVCANPSTAGLVLDGDVEQDELDASAERLQHVTTTHASAAAFDWPTFGPGLAVARHALALAAEPPPPARPRFGWAPDPAYSRALLLAAEPAQAVLQWLLLALANPGATRALPRALEAAQRAGGPLRLTAGEVHAEWARYPDAPLRPSMRALRGAWRAIAPGDLLTRLTLMEHCVTTGATLPAAAERIA